MVRYQYLRWPLVRTSLWQKSALAMPGVQLWPHNRKPCSAWTSPRPNLSRQRANRFKSPMTCSGSGFGSGAPERYAARVKAGPADPLDKMYLEGLVTFAEFVGGLIRIGIREWMARAGAKGKLKSKQPKLSERQ